MKSGHSGAPVASLMLAGLFWLGGCGFAARAQASTSLPSSLPPQQTAWLEYRELSYPIANYPVSFTLQSAPFKKEPNLGGRAATRGIFKFGNNTEQFVSFILDRSQGKLYLDLNRNQDLTDDTHGVFTTTERGVGAYYQSFANIPLTFKTAVGTQPALVDLAIYHYGNPMTVQAGCRYCWEAKTSFQGRDYLLALADNLTGKLGSPEGGYLVLRPWAAGNQAFSVQNASLDGFPFARGLFFAGQTYHLDWSFLRRDGALGYKVELNPQVAELGELKLTGKYVNRLVVDARQQSIADGGARFARGVGEGATGCLPLWINPQAGHGRSPPADLRPVSQPADCRGRNQRRGAGGWRTTYQQRDGHPRGQGSSPGLSTHRFRGAGVRAPRPAQRA